MTPWLRLTLLCLALVCLLLSLTQPAGHQLPIVGSGGLLAVAIRILGYMTFGTPLFAIELNTGIDRA